MLNKVGRNNIICSGVSVASIDIAMLYLRLMNDITLGSTATTRLNTYYDEYINLYLTAGLSNVRNTNDIASLARVPGFSNKFPGCERNGVDQGVHNVLLHNSIIPHVKLFAQGDGPVANMQAGLYKARTNEGPSRSHTIIYNSGGSKYAVAHQYDRNPAFTQNLYKRVRKLILHGIDFCVLVIHRILIIAYLVISAVNCFILLTYSMHIG